MYTLIFEADKLDVNIRLKVFRILLKHSLENNPRFKHIIDSKNIEDNYCLNGMCWRLSPNFAIKEYDTRRYFESIESRNNILFIDLKTLICMLNIDINQIPKDQLINMIEEKCKQY